MAKEILCAYGVDIDAVAGWIGSYGGGDSPDDISRGLFAGEVGTPRMLNLFERNGIKATWFVPGHSIETFPEQVAADRRGGPRDRHARLHAREPDRDDGRAGRGRDAQVRRPHRAGLGPAPDRLRRAVVGVLDDHERAAAQARHQVRPLADARRLHALLRARRRHLDADRLLQEGRGLDGAARSAARRPTSSRSRRAGTSTTCRR